MKQKYIKIVFLSLITILFVLTFQQKVFACRARVPEKMEFFLSHNRDTSYIDDRNYTVDVGGCGSMERGKYLMLTLGANILSPKYTLTNSFNGFLSEDECTMHYYKGSQTRSFNQRSMYYKQQSNYLTTCVLTKITDYSPYGIRFPQDQENCKVQKISEQSAVATGGYCFFNITPGSSFKIEYQKNPKCNDTNFLKENNLIGSDVSGVASLYVAGDASGRSLDLKALDLSKVRVVGEPSQQILPLTMDMGPEFPRWPAVMVQEHEIGKLELIDGAVQSISTSIFSSNICKKTCRGNQCISPCDYDIPLGVQISLYEIKENRKTYLDLWYQGGIIPAQWQGAYSMTHPLPYNYLEVGKKYRMEFNISDPTSNFNVAKSRFEQFLIKLDDFVVRNSRAGTIYDSPSSTLGAIGAIGGIGTIKKTIGRMPTLSYVPEFGLNASFSGVLAALNKLINFSIWPPYYKTLCKSDLSNCIKYEKNKSTMAIEFQISKKTDAGVFIYDNVKVEKKSSLYGSSKKWVAELPYVKCE
jgi:hypothetical protein